MDMLAETLKSYKKAKAAKRKQKAANGSALPTMDEESSVPATLVVSDEGEEEEETAEVGRGRRAVGKERAVRRMALEG
jgi:hypothetical protein